MRFENQAMKKESKESFPMNIELPEDISPELLFALQRKLKEYKGRLERRGDNIAYSPPELLADTQYKIRVLSELLLNGSVNFDDMARKIREEDGAVFEIHLRNAFAVIEDYVKTGGKNVVGGTGI